MKKIKINYNIIVPIIILFIISILSIYSASIYTSKSLGNLVEKQAENFAKFQKLLDELGGSISEGASILSKAEEENAAAAKRLDVD